MIEKGKKLFTTFSVVGYDAEEFNNQFIISKVICAYEIDADDNLRTGFGFCSPKDFWNGKYNRTRGKQLASDRLEVSRTIYPYVTIQASGLLANSIQERDIYPLLKRILLIEARLMDILWMYGVRMSDIY